MREGLMSNPELITGTVKWFNAEKGYGFISSADHGDVFVHLRALTEGRTTLAAGEQVYFTLRQAEKGPEAANVRAGAPPAPPKPALPTVELPTPEIRGHAGLRVVARPEAVKELGRPAQRASLVAFTVELGVEEVAGMSKALPPPSAATACLVLISAKHWRRVAGALDADPEDTLVVDGYASLDPLAPGVITLRATEVTTTALLSAKRAAQAREVAAGEPDETRDGRQETGDARQEMGDGDSE
jgi:CspA family cold shock protein